MPFFFYFFNFFLVVDLFCHLLFLKIIFKIMFQSVASNIICLQARPTEKYQWFPLKTLIKNLKRNKCWGEGFILIVPS